MIALIAKMPLNRRCERFKPTFKPNNGTNGDDFFSIFFLLILLLSWHLMLFDKFIFQPFSLLTYSHLSLFPILSLFFKAFLICCWLRLLEIYSFLILIPVLSLFLGLLALVLVVFGDRLMQCCKLKLRIGSWNERFSNFAFLDFLGILGGTCILNLDFFRRLFVKRLCDVFLVSFMIFSVILSTRIALVLRFLDCDWKTTKKTWKDAL